MTAQSEEVHERESLRSACRAFVASAFAVLTNEHVLPRPDFAPFIQVGRDYFADSIMPLPEFKQLEAALEAEYEGRFGIRQYPLRSEFANSYVFNLLEACVARCAQSRSFDLSNPVIDRSIDQLITVLDEDEYEVVCIRYVSHLTTDGDPEVELEGITIVSEPDGYGGLERRVQLEIPGAWATWQQEDPHVYDPPHALLVARERTSEQDPYVVGRRLSHQMDRFMLVARLLTSGTMRTWHQMIGTTTLITRMHPHMDVLDRQPFGTFKSLVRRTVRLTGQEASGIAALAALVEAAEVKREGMVATSFDVGLRKFNLSHRSDDPYDQMVDLATALEAVLIGGEKETEGLTLRLRTRVAALLSSPSDPAQALFKDVGLLYGLRSKLVHGGQIKEQEIKNKIGAISTVPNNATSDRLGIALFWAVDRMRDIVRRALLARLCLAEQPNPLWPFTGDTAVDEILSDDSNRATWRGRWRGRLSELGVPSAADRPRPAVEFLSPEDR